MDPRLVPGSVFKTGELYGNHAVGGFDSHALPPFFFSGLVQADLLGIRWQPRAVLLAPNHPTVFHGLNTRTMSNKAIKIELRFVRQENEHRKILPIGIIRRAK